ncbi:helix-turn-helix transcriptional regulator [Haloarchaeobius sp. DYHT-AS-18]|uniref:helix-turn-helix transcriptional regulator n=1 Tax=Haloarchaeobius sp. DYHT-AS-18 TaxID=3446117 RepID=UPI003EB9FE70
MTDQHQHANPVESGETPASVTPNDADTCQQQETTDLREEIDGITVATTDRTSLRFQLHADAKPALHPLDHDGRPRTLSWHELSCRYQTGELYLPEESPCVPFGSTTEVLAALADDGDGAEVMKDHGILIADGGTTWADLTAFQRDCMEAIHRLDRDDETTYGLAIKRDLEDNYAEEIHHGRLYPNLDQLREADLVEKTALDKRTNEYTLTAAAEAMLEEHAERLADACGFTVRQPATDGGEDWEVTD